MRTTLFLLIFSLFLVVNNKIAYSANPRAIAGNWETIDDETQKPKSIVRIYKASDGKFYGKIVELLNPEPGKEDPDCEKCEGKYSHYKTSNGKIVGTIFLRGLEYNEEDNIWENGTIFDPKKGKEYSCEVSLDGNTLNVRGIHWTGLSRTQYWHKKAKTK